MMPIATISDNAYYLLSNQLIADTLNGFTCTDSTCGKGAVQNNLIGNAAALSKPSEVWTTVFTL